MVQWSTSWRGVSPSTAFHLILFLFSWPRSVTAEFIVNFLFALCPALVCCDWRLEFLTNVPAETFDCWLPFLSRVSMQCIQSAPMVGALSDDARLTSVCLTSLCLSVAYIGPKSRTERLGKLKLAQRYPTSHVTRIPLSRSKGQSSTCRGRGHIVAACFNSSDLGGWLCRQMGLPSRH